MLATAPPTDNTPAPPPTTTVRGHQSRPSNGRRSISATQPLSGQLSAQANGTTNGNTMPTPVPPKQPQGPSNSAAGPGLPAFETGRSPPGSKNLNHVPCKFFRQGACQAGKACPFSHNTDPTTETTPCKYFSKGNCKFGQKCALAHILPDGRRVNRPSHGHANGHLQFGRVDTGFTNHRSALHNSLMQASVGNVGHHTPNHSLGGQEDFPPLGGQPIPQIDQTISSSLPDSQFGGSPRNQDGFQMSPLASSHRTLGPLDATLPASIDRYDYSYYAKHGPFASSVPNTFGVDSPPPSLPNSIRGGESTVHALRRSAFGDDESNGAELSRSAQLREGSFSERILHSSARRPKVYPSSYAGPQHMMSALNGLKDNDKASDSDGAFAFEEDFVPESLSDLLTPQERNRRMSRTDEEAGMNFRSSITAPGTPADVFGSPPVGSPSTWGPIVSRQRRDEDHQISGIGHVGSPLRNTYLHSDSSPAIRSLNRPTGDISPFTSSPATRGGAGISALTQSLKMTNLLDTEATNGSKSLGPNGKPLERAISSPRLGNGKPVASIDEEAECQFDLEVEEGGTNRQVGGFTSLGGNPARASGLGLDDRYFPGRA
ncbi:hypothetical protein EDC01DRAFT_138532 [Geopyxis carbonaria]|nr:hypothetical protein EDC01DRAFT_138532 [Geopyxis carbonaria]